MTSKTFPHYRIVESHCKPLKDGVMLSFCQGNVKKKGYTSREVGLKLMWMRCGFFLEQHITEIYPH